MADVYHEQKNRYKGYRVKIDMQQSRKPTIELAIKLSEIPRTIVYNNLQNLVNQKIGENE